MVDRAQANDLPVSIDKFREMIRDQAPSAWPGFLVGDTFGTRVNVRNVERNSGRPWRRLHEADGARFIARSARELGRGWCEIVPGDVEGHNVLESALNGEFVGQGSTLGSIELSEGMVGGEEFRATCLRQLVGWAVQK